MSKYTAFFRKLANFQNSVLEKLSHSYYELLPMLTDFFKTDAAFLVLEQDQNLDVVSYGRKKKIYNTDRIDAVEDTSALFEFGNDERILQEAFPKTLREPMSQYNTAGESTYRKVCGDEISGQRYAVFLLSSAKMDLDSLKESMVINVIRLYIENGILHEKLVYESEHDKLTGLFNKGKYTGRQAV